MLVVHKIKEGKVVFVDCELQAQLIALELIDIVVMFTCVVVYLFSFYERQQLV